MVHDEFMAALGRVLEQLDLSTVEKDDTDSGGLFVACFVPAYHRLLKQTAPSFPLLEIRSDVADRVQAVVPGNFSVFVALVMFTRKLLPRLSKSTQCRWMPSFIVTCIQLSTKVNGFAFCQI